jgi:glucose-6-phosphate dehydrogenase assembly protein OpcA
MSEAYIDVVAIEKELKKLWSDMSKQKGQKEAVTRSCVHNLIVYAPGERSDAEVNAVVADVTVQNPGRVFIVLPEPSSSEKKSNAWVSAQCYQTSGSRQQICCEQIMMRVQGEAIKEIASILDPLTVPDLPTFVWWRAPLTQGPPFEDLLEFADRTIVDTAVDQNANLHDVAQILIRNIPECALTDLNWARLTIWRELVARLFDAPDTKNQLREINRVEISAEQPLSFRPLFLASWFGSRLGWKINSKIEKQGKSVHFQCMNNVNRPVDVLIYKREHSEIHRNLESVKIQTESSSFSVHRTEEFFHLEVSDHSSGKILCSEDRKAHPQTEADLLRTEVQILGRDNAYEQALLFLNSIL